MKKINECHLFLLFKVNFFAQLNAKYMDKVGSRSNIYGVTTKFLFKLDYYNTFAEILAWIS